MREARAGSIVLLLVALWAGCGDGEPERGRAASSAADSLAGAWELRRAETVAPDGTVTPYSTQESFLLFTADHYSMNWAGGSEPTPPYGEPFQPTEEEALARYRSLLVNAGRYAASGGTLTIEPRFALVPEFVGGSGTFEYRLSGDSLRLRWTRIVARDGQPDPWTARGYSYRYTFVRID